MSRIKTPFLIHATITLGLIMALTSCQPAGTSIDANKPQISLATSPPTPLPHPTSIGETAQTTYAMTQTLSIKNLGPDTPDKHNLWVALIHDLPPYQQVISTTINPPPATRFSDEYDNRYAEFDLRAGVLSSLGTGKTLTITLAYQIRVNRIQQESIPDSGEVLADFTRPELHVESQNPQILALARRLAPADATPRDVVRAFYRYVGENLIYSYNGKDWGAQAALGEMGADCTEYASLLMALSRARGIPARYLAGLVYYENQTTRLARVEHAWLEVYLPNTGWVPMDPTLGRTSLTRERYFAAMPSDHIIVTRGRNPSTLRGASYWTHLYWPGNSADIRVQDHGWEMTPLVKD